MSADTHLRTTARDLADVAAELRAEADAKREEQQALVAQVEREYDGDAEAAPQDLHDEYDQLQAEIAELEGTAETFEHYADTWGEDGTAEFVLKELNGDEYAKVVDTVSGAAPNPQGAQDLPGGAAAVQALNHAAVDIPPGAPADAGKWPAPIVNDLFEELNDLTTPGASDAGNSSLSAAVSQQADTATDGGGTPDSAEGQ